MQSKTSLLVLGLSSTIWLLGGCSPKQADQNTDQTASSPVSTGQSATQTPENVRSFAATPRDAHDIAVLEDYNEKFQTMTIESDRDMARLKQDGYLTTAMEIERRRDHARSATNMLKALSLETEQGRYIQGLLYQYWQTQYESYTTPTTAASTATATQPDNGKITELTLAEAQLKHWKSMPAGNKR